MHYPSDHLRHRREALQAEERAARPPPPKPSVRMPKDFVKRRVWRHDDVPGDEQLGMPAHDDASATLIFDASRYRAFLHKTAPVRLRQTERTI